MDISIGPTFPILTIRFKGNHVAFIPMVHLDIERERLNKCSLDTAWFHHTGATVPDDPQQRHSFAKRLLNTFTWNEIALYVQSHGYPEAHLKAMWEGTEHEASFDLEVLRVPSRLYKYTKYDEQDLEQLLKCGLLEMKSPLSFNDPWDCNYTPEVR